MEPLSLTALRKRLYQVVDQVLATGVPIEVERNGQRLVIAPVEASLSKLSGLKQRDAIIGDPDDLVELEVASWTEPSNLTSPT